MVVQNRREEGGTTMSTAECLRELYRRRNIELAVFSELTDPVLIDASVYRIKAIDEQISAARAALKVA